MTSPSSLVLLKPDVVSHPILLKLVFDELLASGLRILAIRPLRLDRSQAENLYSMHKGRFYYGRLVRHISSGPVVALQVIGDARTVLGSSKLFPFTHGKDLSLRQRFAISDVRNVAHNSDPENAQKELQMMEPLGTIKHFSQIEQSLSKLYQR